MVAGRRAVQVDEAHRWVFNRIADVYDARPPYPTAVVSALAALAGSPAARVGDVGAGTGHLAVPLAARGLDVTAFEPARDMLGRLRARAAAEGTALRAVHAAAENLPAPDGAFDLLVVADAVHFIDAELAGRELSRVLARRGALAIVTVEPDVDTPFMHGVVAAMRAAAPRRPRSSSQAIVQLLAMAGARRRDAATLVDRTPVDAAQLERILRSISFVGPAMNDERFAAFRERVLSLEGPWLWSRRITLHSGRRGR